MQTFTFCRISRSININLKRLQRFSLWVFVFGTLLQNLKSTISNSIFQNQARQFVSRDTMIQILRRNEIKPAILRKVNNHIFELSAFNNFKSFEKIDAMTARQRMFTKYLLSSVDCIDRNTAFSCSHIILRERFWEDIDYIKSTERIDILNVIPYSPVWPREPKILKSVALE